MTGPSSWRQFHDMHSTERSEAWSELLGLRSNPRTTSGVSLPSSTSLFSSQSLSQSRTATAGFLPELLEGAPCRPGLPTESPIASCMPAVAENSSRRNSLDSVFAAIPVSTSDKQPSAAPAQGLHSLDPFFANMECSSSARLQQPQCTGITTRKSLPRERKYRPISSMSPSASQPLLHQQSMNKRAISRAPSSIALASEAMGMAAEVMSPVTSEAVIQQESYRRAALDFVLELAGPQLQSAAARIPLAARDTRPAGEPCAAPALFKADELPIPAFAIDRDASVTTWNKQLAQLSGWEEEDMAEGLTQLGAVFQADSKHGARNKGCMELMRGVLFGMVPLNGARFLLRKKSEGHRRMGKAAEPQEQNHSRWDVAGRPPARRPRSKSVGDPAQLSWAAASCVPVELRFNRRTDAVGAVIGVVCVVVPLKEELPPTCETCTRTSGNLVEGALRHRESFTERTPERANASGSIFDPCPSSNSSSCSGGSESSQALQKQATTFAMPRSPSQEQAPPLPASPSLRPCKEYQAGTSREEQGGPSEVRALVMDSVDAVRTELTHNLERCGVEVVSCASAAEAIWRFEGSLADPAEGPKFDVIFLELQPNSEELYLAIRDLRRLEVESRVMGEVTHWEPHGAGASLVPSSPAALANSHARDSCSNARDSSCAWTTGSGAVAGGLLMRELVQEIRGSNAEGEVKTQTEFRRPGMQSMALDECAPDNVREEEAAGRGGMMERETSLGAAPLQEAQDSEEKRCLILAAVNLNRWDLAGLDTVMEQCVRAGGDAVIPRSMPLQQLKGALRKLGIRSKYLMFPSRLPRALSGNLHNPLNLSR